MNDSNSTTIHKKVVYKRSLLEYLLIIGIITVFIWPFVQLWTIKAIPIVVSDSHQRAVIALENLMAQALSQPFTEFQKAEKFRPIKGGEDIGLEGMVEVLPHPESYELTVVRAKIRWGIFLFRKYLTLEAIITQNRV